MEKIPFNSKSLRMILSVLLSLILSLSSFQITLSSELDSAGYDVILILDKSGGIESDEFDSIKSSACNFIDLLLGKESLNRIAAVEFAAGASILSSAYNDFFASWEDKDSLKSLINSMEADGSGDRGLQAAIALSQSIALRRGDDARLNKPVYILITYGVPNYYHVDGSGYIEVYNPETINETELYFSKSSYSFHATQGAMSQIVNAKTMNDSSEFYAFMAGDYVNLSHDSSHQELCYKNAMLNPNGIYIDEITHFEHLFISSLRKEISKRSDGKLINGDNYIDSYAATGFGNLNDELSELASFMSPGSNNVIIDVRNSVKSSNVIHPSSIPSFKFQMYKLNAQELSDSESDLIPLAGENTSLIIQPDTINSSKSESFDFTPEEFTGLMAKNEILPENEVYTVYIKEGSNEKTPNWDYSQRVVEVNVNAENGDVEYINHDYINSGYKNIKSIGLYEASEAYFTNSFNRVLSLDIPVSKSISHKAGADLSETPASFTFYISLDESGEEPVYIDKVNESGLVEATLLYDGSDYITGVLKISDFTKLAEDYSIVSETGDYTLYIVEKDESSGDWVYSPDGDPSRELNIFVNKVETQNGPQISLKSVDGAENGHVEFCNSYNKGYDVTLNIYKWNDKENNWAHVNSPGEKIGEDISRGGVFTGADNIIASYINENSRFINFTGDIISSSDYESVINAIKSFEVNKDTELNLYLLDREYENYVSLSPVTVSKKIEKAYDMTFPEDFSFTYILKDAENKAYGSVIFNKSDFFDAQGNFKDTATKQIDIDGRILPGDENILYLHEEMPEGLSNNWIQDENNGRISIDIGPGREWAFSDGSKAELALISKYIEPAPENNISVSVESVISVEDIEAFNIFHESENGVSGSSVISFKYGIFKDDADEPMNTKTVQIPYGSLIELLNDAGEDSEVMIPKEYFINEDNEFIIQPEYYYNEETPQNTKFGIRQTEASITEGEAVSLADLGWNLSEAKAEFTLNRFGAGDNNGSYSFSNGFGGRISQSIYISCLMDGPENQAAFNVSGGIAGINGYYIVDIENGKAVKELKFTSDINDNESVVKVQMEAISNEYGVLEWSNPEGIERILTGGRLSESNFSFSNTFYKYPEIEVIRHINIRSSEINENEEFIFELYDGDSLLGSRSIIVSKNEPGPFSTSFTLKGYDGGSSGKSGSLRLVEKEGFSESWGYSKAEYTIEVSNGEASIINSDDGKIYATASFMAIYNKRPSGELNVKKYIFKPEIKNYEALAGENLDFTINIINDIGLEVSLTEIEDRHILEADRIDLSLNENKIDESLYKITDKGISFNDSYKVQGGEFITLNYSMDMDFGEGNFESPVAAKGHVESYGEVSGSDCVHIAVKEPSPVYSLSKIVLNNKNYFINGETVEYSIMASHSPLSQVEYIDVGFLDTEFKNATGLRVSQDGMNFDEISPEGLESAGFRLNKGDSVLIRYGLLINEDMGAQFTNTVEMSVRTDRGRILTETDSETIDILRRQREPGITAGSSSGPVSYDGRGKSDGGEVILPAPNEAAYLPGAVSGLPQGGVGTSQQAIPEGLEAEKARENADKEAVLDETIELGQGLLPLGKINPETKVPKAIGMAFLGSLTTGLAALWLIVTFRQNSNRK